MKDFLKMFGTAMLLLVGIAGIVEASEPGLQIVWGIAGGAGIGSFTSILWLRSE